MTEMNELPVEWLIFICKASKTRLVIEDGKITGTVQKEEEE